MNFIPHRAMHDRKAFTLAEVLITLGIIGIVASMTLPALVGKYQKVQTISKLKETYSIISQATKRAEADYGDAQYWGEIAPAEKFVTKYIRPYYKIIQEYDKTTFPADFHNYCINGVECDSYGGLHSSPHVILNNGVMLTINATLSDTRTFIIYIVDLNGFQKPNMFGKDVFVFNLEPGKGIVPYGSGLIAGETAGKPAKTRDELMHGSDYRTCKTHGQFCSAVIMMDGWQISTDYPW